MIHFIVPGQPVAQPRHRHGTRNGYPVSYLPADHPVHAYKQGIAIAAREVYKDEPLTGALKLALIFVIKRPKELFAKKYPRERIRHTVKPDLDNLQKSVKDALKMITWADDSQVCVVEGYKFYSATDEEPSTSVVVTTV